jgi:hypothetical protein
LALIAALFALARPVGASNVTPNAIWADGRLYGTVVTLTSLPDRGKFDTIYNFSGGGLRGQRSIADAKPGDQDFNGGRWEVHFVSYTAAGLAHFDPDGDGVANYELTSDSALMSAAASGYLSVDPNVARRFVCTLNP